jgi:uncharacterized membrane protein YphA (DoxX/SURF4 family)
MNKNKLLILFILRLVIFGLFMMSGILKLYPSIVPFEKQLVDFGFVDWCQAPYMARLIIALELALGFAFLQSNYLKKIVIPATAFLLIAFCVHLSIIIYTQGANSGNCGCFGQLIPMTPLQALIKNIITLGILGYMYIIYREKDKNNILVLAIVYLGCNLILFILYPFSPCNQLKVETIEVLPLTVDTSKILTVDSLKKDTIVAPVPLQLLNQNKKIIPTDTVKKVELIKPDALCPVKKISVYAPFKIFNDGITADLDNGKKIVTLFSLECEHCMETAKKIGELSKKRQIPATYFLFWGTEDQVENFFKVAQHRFPYKIIDPSTFFQLLGSAPSPPKVSYLCNGNIIAEFDNSTFSSEKLEEALNK